jgi:cytochrome c
MSFYTRNALGLALLLALGGAASMPALAQTSSPTQATEAMRLSERWDEKRAGALLERAVAHVEAKGQDALTDFSRQGSFVDGDLYVYALANDGRFLASGGSSAALIGSNVSGVDSENGK